MKYILMILTLLFSLNAKASEQEAKVFVDNLAKSVIAILATSDDMKQKESKLTILFEQNVDIGWIGDFALGRYKKTIKQNEYAQYQQLYHKFLINNYIPNFRKYNNNEVSVTKVTKQDENSYLVQTEIIRKDAPKLLINYMVKNNPDGMKIFDIIAEGVSLASSQRSEFSSIIPERGINGLLTVLAEKVGEN